ncbi:MAG: type IV secretory system conjugative DNA transfer family protein [Thaumarchaeota archaeon]|nr:type IV secretory system conjugative DNA transfer family protein [Nitrososphaerota archaeon]
MPTSQVHWSVNADTNRKVSALVKEMGFRNREQALLALVETQKDKIVPYVSYENIFNSPAPCIITGEPYTGKTTSIKNLIPEIKGSILCIDPHNEYDMLKKHSGSSIQFNRLQRIRIIPSQNPFVSEAQITSLFMNLNESRERMKGWTLIIDEAHRFAKVDLVRSFIAEARKFNIKVIIITSDFPKFLGLGYVLKPKPLVVLQ